MTDEEVKKDPMKAIRFYADELTAEQLDYCVREWPDTALVFCADKLTEEQKQYCEKIKKEKANEGCSKSNKKDIGSIKI